MLFKPWQPMLTSYAEQVFKAAIICAPRQSIEPQVIRVAFTVSNFVTHKLVVGRRASIEVPYPEVDADVDSVINRSTICTAAPMKIDLTYQFVAAMDPGSAATISPDESERGYQFCKVTAHPFHAGLYNRRCSFPIGFHRT